MLSSADVSIAAGRPVLLADRHFRECHLDERDGCEQVYQVKSIVMAGRLCNKVRWLAEQEGSEDAN